MKKKPSRPISEEYYDRFKYKLQEENNKWSERNLTLFLLGVATGYRIQDIICFTVGEMQEALRNGYFEIQEKKQYNAWKTCIKKHPKSLKKIPLKRRHDIVPQLAAILKKYIKGKRKSEFVFRSQKGNGNLHLSAKAYSDILKNVAEKLNLKNITGHSLRKTYARRLYEATNDLEYVRIALGHKSIEVTKKYLALDDEVKEGAAKIVARKL